MILSALAGCGKDEAKPAGGQSQQMLGNDPDPASQFAPDTLVVSDQPSGVWGAEGGVVTTKGVTVYRQFVISATSVQFYVTCYYRGVVAQAIAEARAQFTGGKVEVLASDEKIIEKPLGNTAKLQCGAQLPRMKLAFEIHSNGVDADWGNFYDEAKPSEKLKLVRQKLYLAK